ncbi:MAG: dTDP-4-amino-4,6-dideoxygalactose transaminase, partial [Yoonia sp.]
MIPYGRQSIDQNDIDAVVAVLKSDFLTQGPVVPRFEAALAQYCDVSHAVA